MQSIKSGCITRQGNRLSIAWEEEKCEHRVKIKSKYFSCTMTLGKCSRVDV